MTTKHLDAGTIRIVVTDSGLGGLSVLAELENNLSKIHVFQNAELIFFNSVYSKDLGYNEMKSSEEKANVFNNALYTIQNNYKPDIILIACNTLSVVYPMTQFSKQSETKVEGIVKAGVELFLENLKKENNSLIILFGTPTTIDSGLHKSLLIEKGIDEHRIINQSCPILESEIQDDPESVKVFDLIRQFVNEAGNKIINRNEKVYAGFCCTHYGYSSDIFFKIMKNKFGGNVEILNPNNKMVESLMKDRTENYKNSTLSVKVVSQVEIYEHEKQALSKILINTAPLTVEAIENYDLRPNLFGK
ncbi:MAG: aspartate/glutamate racemase family protein [Chlorobi bacterium]|nr:aspartate/glutamate racemase family protein [Chlorobiota bacterium]